MNSTTRLAQLAAVHGAALIICTLAVPVFAVDCLELVGTWPFDPAHAIAASGDYAYFGSGSALLVADVSDPGAPNVVGQVVLPDSIGDIEVSGNHVYLAAWDAGLRVVDVSDPTNPVEVGFVDTPGRARDVAVSDGFAYVADTREGLRVIDVSDPTDPVEGAFVPSINFTTHVVVSEEYALMADNSGWIGQGVLRIFDVSEPSAPVEAGSIGTGWFQSVGVSGSYAYMAVGIVSDPQSYSTLVVVDVSTPSNPVEAGRLYLWRARSIAVSGGFAYGARDDAGLSVVDVSDPTDPVEIWLFDTPGEAVDVAVSGGYVYLADGDAGMEIFLGCECFSDSFESGDTTAWSAAVP